MQEVTLQAIEAFRCVYALCDISPTTKRLKASHYATCLAGGRTPLWGVFNVDGKLLWFYESREGIATHPNFKRKAWRTKQAAWTIGRVESDMDGEEKRDHIRRQRGRKNKRRGGNVLAFKRKVA